MGGVVSDMGDLFGDGRGFEREVRERGEFERSVFAGDVDDRKSRIDRAFGLFVKHHGEPKVDGATIFFEVEKEAALGFFDDMASKQILVSEVFESRERRGGIGKAQEDAFLFLFGVDGKRDRMGAKGAEVAAQTKE